MRQATEILGEVRIGMARGVSPDGRAPQHLVEHLLREVLREGIAERQVHEQKVTRVR